MSDDITIVKELDLRNLPCPMPVVKVSKAVKDLQVGQVLRATTTDPGALTDFPAWAKSTGNAILATEEAAGETHFTIKRLK